MSALARMMATKIVRSINLKKQDSFESIDDAIKYYQNNASLFSDGYAEKLVNELNKLIPVTTENS